jgi:hypothetical protein
VERSAAAIDALVDGVTVVVDGDLSWGTRTCHYWPIYTLGTPNF